MAKKISETRNFELRSVNEDGTFEGYLTVWDTVDDYNSTFVRGSFKKTIEERGNKVKIFYDHEHLVGSSLEVREDDYGVFGKGKLNLNVPKANEAYQFMLDKTIDGLSFGFRTIKETFEGGVRKIKEVALYEYGPVAFPANDSALITSIRSSVDFNVTFNEDQLRKMRYTIIDSLVNTLDEVWYSSNGDQSNLLLLVEDAIAKFTASYLQFTNSWIQTFWSGNGFREMPFSNDLVKAFFESRKTVEEFCQETSLTKKELEDLKSGKLIENRSKLDELPEAIKTAHQSLRNKAIETLCSELRGSLSDVEKSRFNSLLSITENAKEVEEPDDEIVKYLIELRKQFNPGEDNG